MINRISCYPYSTKTTPRLVRHTVFFRKKKNVLVVTSDHAVNFVELEGFFLNLFKGNSFVNLFYFYKGISLNILVKNDLCGIRTTTLNIPDMFVNNYTI